MIPPSHSAYAQTAGDSGLQSHVLALRFTTAKFKKARLLVLLFSLISLIVSPVRAATLPNGFLETDVLGYWPEIAGITFDSTGVMYAWERSGRIWIVENDVKATRSRHTLQLLR